MPDASDAASFDRTRAELFDALGHPVRIRILHALEDGPLGFSDLRRKVGLESGGHLQFHLGKLDGLVQTTADNTYMLTDDGREALRIVSTQAASSRGLSDEKQQGGKIIVSRAILVGLIAAVLLLASVAALQQAGVIRTSIPQPAPSLTFPSTVVSNASALLLRVMVWPVAFNPSQKVTVLVDLYNPTNKGIQVEAEMEWGYQGPLGECGGHLVNSFSVFSGYWTEDNISGASAVQYQPSICSSPPGPTPVTFTFYPNSNVAEVNDSSVTIESISQYITLSGYPTVNNGSYTLGPFPIGTYTVLVRDAWGHQALGYFYVDSVIYAIGD
jgi:DNA-binding transcriptional ArsR family regulator